MRCKRRRLRWGTSPSAARTGLSRCILCACMHSCSQAAWSCYESIPWLLLDPSSPTRTYHLCQWLPSNGVGSTCMESRLPLLPAVSTAGRLDRGGGGGEGGGGGGWDVLKIGEQSHMVVAGVTPVASRHVILWPHLFLAQEVATAVKNDSPKVPPATLQETFWPVDLNQDPMQTPPELVGYTFLQPGMRTAYVRIAQGYGGWGEGEGRQRALSHCHHLRCSRYCRRRRLQVSSSATQNDSKMQNPSKLRA